MTTTTNVEKIFQIWSDRKEREIAVRISFSREDAGTQRARVFRLNSREEWF